MTRSVREGDDTVEDVVLRVDGMTCEGCEGRIRGALQRLSGVHGVAASHERGEVRVTSDPTKISRDEVRRAVARAGYEVAS